MKNGVEVLEDITERLRALAEQEPEIALELRRYADDLDRIARDLSAYLFTVGRANSKPS